MPGRLQFDFTFSHPQTGSPPGQRSDGAMRILLMGDFSGRSNRGLCETGHKLTNRRILQVDIDNIDATMTHIAPQLRLTANDSDRSDVAMQFTHLDDFHPDNLYKNLELFQDLRALRTRLIDAVSFPQAAAELRHVALQTQPAQPHTPAPAPATREPALVEDDDVMFERLLGKQSTHAAETSSGARQTRPQTTIQKLIRDVVEPYAVPESEPFQSQYVAMVDEAISKQMRELLHHPDFQALESLWRSVYTLVSSLETDEHLKLHLFDISKQELADDLSATQGQLENSQLYKLLVEKDATTLGGEPWSLLIGGYSFTTESADLSLLAALGAIGSQAGGPFLASAHASLLQCQSLVETPDPRDWRHGDKEAEQQWQALRQSAVAPWIGLAHPRLLLRLPYGKNSDALENFEFEELGSEPEHEHFLWGNPTFTCALLIATAYQSRGWSMTPGDVLDVEDLPAYTFDEDGETKLMADAEVFLTEHAAETMLDRGVMPLISYRNRNAVRVMRIQSIADPHKALAGPWARSH